LSKYKKVSTKAKIQLLPKMGRVGHIS